MRRRLLAGLATALGALALSAVPAAALTEHVYSTSFASAGSGAGEVSSPAGVAVDSVTHDVYIADTGNDRVDELSATGTFIGTFGQDVNKTKSEPLSSASQAEKNICTSAEVALGSECQKGASGSAPGQFETPVFVAVDNSGGPSAGDVYVGDTGDNLVTKFSSAGKLEESWGVKGQLDGASTGAGSFGEIAGVAVDGSGALDVIDHFSQFFKFGQESVFSEEFKAPREETDLDGLAVDAAGDFFKGNGDNSVEEVTGSDGDVGKVTAGVEAVDVAVGAAGDLYAAEHGVVRHYVFAEPGVVSEPGGVTCTVAPSGCPATDSFGSGEPSGGELTGGSGIGVDPSTGDVYVADAAAGRVDVYSPIVVPDIVTGPAGEVHPTSATLNGTVDPDGVEVTDCHFDYVPKAQFESEKGAWTGVTARERAPCEHPDAAEVGGGASPVPVHAGVTGLTVGTTYEVRLQAENANDHPALGGVASFATQPPPAITGATTSNLAAESVDLEAQIDPGGLEIESCVFEYGTEAGVYAKQLECTPAAAQLGAGTTPVPIAQHLEHLTPNISYHWRIVASNAAGTTAGPDHTFIYPQAAAGLPDDRAYEMVTPPHKNAALIGDLPFGAPDIAENGERLMTITAQCFAGAQSCVPIRGIPDVGVPYEFSRTPAGWAPTPLTPSASEFAADSFIGYNADAGTVLFTAPTSPDGEDDFYAREPETATEGAKFVDIGPVTPPRDGATPFEEIGKVGAEGVEATADLSHVVFYHVNPPWPVEGSELEYTHAGSVEPMVVGASGAAADLIHTCKTEITQSGDKGFSADGKIVYLGVSECLAPVRELLASVNNGEVGAETLPVSEPRQLSPAEPDDECTGECEEDISAAHQSNWRSATFAGSSNDGSKVFFTSEQRLTDDATEGPSAAECRDEAADCNLYLYDMDSPVGYRLIDVSAGADGAPAAGGPRVQGKAVAFSSDGSHVYFVARGRLTGVPNAEGQTAVEGQNNLYVFERHCPADEAKCATHMQRTAFIATLPQSDENEWESTENPANVTPDGRFLVFTSHAALTPDATRTDGAVQVYRYDAGSDSHPPTLQRISIGERGFDDDGNGGVGNAQIVPGERGYDHLGPGRGDPTMSGDGSRVFFMSPIALTAGALDDVPIGKQNENQETAYAENVYEWEQAGAGSCLAKEAAGCVFLISDGHDTSIATADLCSPDISAVCLLGADAEGKNVFFTTADSLVPQDTDTQLDVYDARICEPDATPANPCISEPPPPPAPCNEEACHGIPPERSALLSGGSETFTGAGNLTPAAPAVKPKALTRAQKLAGALKACAKDRKKSKRKRCEATARKKYGPAKQKKAKKSSHKGRA